MIMQRAVNAKLQMIRRDVIDVQLATFILCPVPTSTRNLMFLLASIHDSS